MSAPQFLRVALLPLYTKEVGMTPAALAYVQLGAATLASLLGYGISFHLLSKVLNVVPMGISYGIWSGIGIVLVSLLGLLVFGQKLDLAACLGLGLIVLGVLVIHFFSGSMPH